MKFSLITGLLALAVLSTAAPFADHEDPMTRQQQQAVINSVNDWRTDVMNVNSFLNKVFNKQLHGNQLAQAAKTALSFAQNEPIQLTLESGLKGLSPAGVKASKDLANVFGPDVLNNLNIVIENASSNNTAAVTTAVTAINQIRCTHVLPDLDNLWPAAFAAVKVFQNPGRAPRPSACAFISGSS